MAGEIKSTSVNTEKRLLEITLNDTKTYSYPVVWIRDNCRCDKCLFVTSDARKTAINNLDLDMNIEHVEIIDEGTSLTISWPDDHKAVYPVNWWIKKQFTKENFTKRETFRKLPSKQWGPEKTSISKVDFDKMMSDDLSLYKTLVALEEDGLVILQNSPVKKSEDILADRLNTWLRPQSQGETFETRRVFIMKANVQQFKEHNIQAYAAGPLGFHTDQCYTEFPPGLLMLHCISTTGVTGGESIFADGFKAASVMREQHPEYFKILSQCPVIHKDFGRYYYDYQLEANSPTIRLDRDGEVEAIRYSNYQRRSDLNIPVEQVELFYRAYKQFEQVLDDSHIEYLLRPGDMAIIDNHRILHGRCSFEIAGSAGERFLDGSYMDWDDLLSARRVLQLKFKAAES